MKINGVNICNCDGAVGHSDNCLRLAWRAARKFERSQKDKKEPTVKQSKIDLYRKCSTCFYNDAPVCPGAKHGDHACSGQGFKYWEPVINSKKES